MKLQTLLNTIKTMVDQDTKVFSQTVQKGNKKLTGISIGEGDICPVVYVEDFKDLFDSGNYEDVAKEMIKICKNAVKNNNVVNMNVENITSWDYAKEHLLLCIKPASNENDFITIPYLDLELYFRVNLSEGTYKVNEKMLDMWKVSKKELLEIAFHSNKYVTSSMKDILIAMLKDNGAPDFQIKEIENDNSTNQTVITTSNNLFGASALYHKEILKRVAEQYESDLYIIPSSIHELIACPLNDYATMEDMNKMVRDVNNTEVSPEEILSNHVYIFHRNTMDIDW